MLPLVVFLAAAQGPEVSVASLLPQMTDFGHLTRPSRPAYTAGQASSYDRASDPGPKVDPFANGDAGKFVRVEQIEGRTEYVLADLAGPGAVLRLWSANPNGVIRFYFDGEVKPRIEADMAKLLKGQVAPWTEPFGYEAALGTNLYFPLPYAKSLKVTVDDRDKKARELYYQVGYRTYESGTRVRTFAPADLARARRGMAEVAARLTGSAVPNRSIYPGGTKRYPLTNTVLPGRTATLNIQGSGTVRELRVKIPFPLVQSVKELAWNDPHQPHNVLRGLILRVSFDGRRTIEAPLGDFFGSAPGLNPYKSLPFEVSPDGAMICRLPMPHHQEARFFLDNVGSVAVPLELEVTREERRPAEDSYFLYAQWGGVKGQSRPFLDMNFLDAKGEGYWLGSMMHIENPHVAWWGEGDEKVYVDGEAFPSTFGTGTEDYYGYAWCANLLFQRAYHAQTRCDGPGNYGHTSINRWHVLDPIPFKKSIRFDMERWHWVDVPSSYLHTAYWYAKPGSTSPRPLNKSLLSVQELQGPKPVEGAIEGEKLAIAEHLGGTLQPQSGFWDLSSGNQLWWKDVEPGNRIKLTVPVEETGTYEVVGNFCHAVDYGKHRLSFAGKDLGEFDFYAPTLGWKLVPLGTMTLTKGTTTFEVRCLGANPAAKPGKMFGLDYLLLKRK